MTGYRLAMIMAGAGALAFAAWFGSNSEYDPNGWKYAYFIMASLMLIGSSPHCAFMNRPSTALKSIRLKTTTNSACWTRATRHKWHALPLGPIPLR
ncbi:AmpG permease [Photobacterium aphoticum]|uniref:AmpG permease n=1 Tax=Photobacterium aphoticum TaxID=754436 RepID=A0A090QWY6_9GAMM|nr:AmpG permease [Photobacterium aphoticum]